MYSDSKLSIVTCMDSRLLLEKMFGLDIGDAEIIRNAGGCGSRQLQCACMVLGCVEIIGGFCSAGARLQVRAK